MELSAIIITIAFVFIIAMIITDKMNRAIASLIGAVITYAILVFREHYQFTIIVDLIVGTEADDFVNIHTLILVISMMMIVQVFTKSGIFQFFSIVLIKRSKGRPVLLLCIFCILSVIIAAILNNVLSVIILIPLTITVCKMLKINPAPYILCEAILVNLGATLFSISSIPNILIASYAGITFSEFFLSVGLISIVTLICTIMFFAMLYRKTLTKPDSILIEVLEDFNNWNVVSDRKLLKKSMVGLILLFGLFLTIPSNIIPLDIIALSIAILLSLISRLDPKDIIQKIDMDLILYLIGIFIVSGGLELTGVIELLGNFISGILGSSQLGQIILIMWVSAIASSNIDNIPITKVLVPIIGDITQGLGYGDSKILYYSLALGANWGDNLTPLGDNVLVMKIAEEQKSPITVKQFFKLGFVTTILQLMFVSVIFIIMYSLVLGLTILAILIGLFLLMRIITKKGSEKVRTKIAKISEKMRNAIIA